MREPNAKETCESYCLLCGEIIYYDYRCKRECPNDRMDITGRPRKETGTAYYAFIRCEPWES